MNDDLYKGGPQGTLCWPDNPWNITGKTYILKNLDNIILFRSEYTATSIIKYSPYIDNKFILENVSHTSKRQHIKVINLNPSTEISWDIFMPKYNQLIMDRYIDEFFLIRQITEHHKNLTILGILSVAIITLQIIPY